MKYYYVYRLTCSHPASQEKYYYGSRSCTGLPSEDTAYWSSSRFVQRARRLYGNMWFQKKILAIFPTHDEALALEIRLHARFDVKNHPLFFNRANQTVTSFTTQGPLGDAHKEKLKHAAFGRRHSEMSKQKMSDALKGKPRRALSDAHKEAIRQGVMKKNQQKNEQGAPYSHSAETRAKMSRTRQAKKTSPETRKKISESLRLRRLSQQKQTSKTTSSDSTRIAHEGEKSSPLEERENGS